MMICCDTQINKRKEKGKSTNQRVTARCFINESIPAQVTCLYSGSILE